MTRKSVACLVGGIAMALILQGYISPSIAAESTVGSDTFKLDSVTVTAQKQKENLQEVPLSVSVFNDLETKDRSIKTVAEIADFIPNLQIQPQGTSGSNIPVMRGISALLSSMAVSTGLFVDGVPMLSAYGYEEVITDIERVEILRGPQGTLYGRGTETGAIIIITRQPTNEFKGLVSASVGSLLSKETDAGMTQSYELNLSGPIKEDMLFFSLAGQYVQKDGFIQNTYWDTSANDKENWFGRGKIHWLPTDQWGITFIASHKTHNDDGTDLILSQMGTEMFGLPALKDRKVTSDLLGHHEAHNNSQSLKVEYDISSLMTITSITSNWSHDRNQLIDWDSSSVAYMNETTDFEYDIISQELRLDYSSKKLKWLAGLYFDTIENSTLSITNSILSGRVGVVSMDSSTKGQSYAGFGNVTYNIFDKLSVIGGLRYEIDEREFENNLSQINQDESWDVITPKLALQYQFSPKAMTYISASEGYRSGGFNINSRNPEYYKYDPEKLWSYELGVKSNFLNNRVMVNAAVFYMDIENMQVEEAVSAYEIYLTNAAGASGLGAELEINARITDTFSVTGSFGVINLEFDEFSDSYGNYEGNKNPYAPEYTFNLGAQYRHSGGFFARADLIEYGKTYFDKENNYSRDPYMLVNLKMGYEFKKFDIYLEGKNIFDQEYNSEGVFKGYYDIYSEPGEIALKVVYRF